MKNFDLLVNSIAQTHEGFQQQAVKAVNINLTLRNWLIGFYIVEFEQNGEDRAKYGQGLIPTIADRIKIKGLGETSIKLCRQFYYDYSQLLAGNNFEVLKDMLPKQLEQTFLQQLEHSLSIRQSLTDELQNNENELIIIRQSPTDELGQENNNAYLAHLVQRTSFTHFVELLKIENTIKRKFYELLILKTTPSVKELQRQINTLAYERMGMSQNNDKAFEQLSQKIEPETAVDAVKSIYLFDFMGLKSEHLVEEKELEIALLNHLQEFILELGHGFCFEARQQRILIDQEYFFADLVFYHRILKCHILIEGGFKS